MTRIFEALKKARVPHPQAASPVPAPPLQSLRAHAGGPASAAASMPSPERLGLMPRACDLVLDLPEDVVREMTALRMTLESALGPRMPKAVLFTSALSGEGTSTVAAQFAATLTRDASLRVLLMDLNARRPSPFVEGEAPARPNRPHGVAPIHVATESTSRFDVAPVPTGMREAGAIPGPSAREWVDAFSNRYDWIVLDAPAVLEAPDAPGLAAVADGAVIVVEAGRTKRPVLHRATDLLRKARANLLGSVLNRRRLEIPEFLYRRI